MCVACLIVMNLHNCGTGANVNAKDQGLLTPLHRAATSQNEVRLYFNSNWENRFLRAWQPDVALLFIMFWGFFSRYFSIFWTESCGSPTQAQGRGQRAWQVLAHAVALCCFQVGHWVCLGFGTARVQPGCCGQIWKDTSTSCGVQWQRRGELWQLCLTLL